MGKNYPLKDLLRGYEKMAAWLEKDYNDYVVIDPKFYRPAEVDLLISNPEKAKKVLGWEPSITFRELVEMMVKADLQQLSEDDSSQVTRKFISS